MQSRDRSGRQEWCTDSPHQAGLHRCGVLIDVIAIETEARLQSQAVPCTQACQLDLSVGQQLLSQSHNTRTRHRDLRRVQRDAEVQ